MMKSARELIFETIADIGQIMEDVAASLNGQPIKPVKDFSARPKWYSPRPTRRQNNFDMDFDTPGGSYRHRWPLMDEKDLKALLEDELRLKSDKAATKQRKTPD